MSSLSMYFPQYYTNGDALACAKLVNVAYEQVAQWIADKCPSRSDFQWKFPSNGYAFSQPLFWTYSWGFGLYDEPFGFVAVDQNGNAYLVFRGTVTDADELYDACLDQVRYSLSPHYGFVHSGFYDIYSALSTQVLAALASMRQPRPFRRLFFTGHSLGCGLSTLAIPDVITNGGLSPSTLLMTHYNFASPRVGDPVFAGMMNGNGVPTFRVVNTEDLVPTLPPSVSGDIIYKHIGTPVDFTAQYATTDGNHSLTGAYLYALMNPYSPEGMLPERQSAAVRIAAGARLSQPVPLQTGMAPAGGSAEPAREG